MQNERVCLYEGGECKEEGQGTKGTAKALIRKFPQEATKTKEEKAVSTWHVESDLVDDLHDKLAHILADADGGAVIHGECTPSHEE